MPLSWNAIKTRAIAFSREWAEETRETAETKSFWDASFMSSESTAEPWPCSRIPSAPCKAPTTASTCSGTAAGKNLDKAKGQAFDNIQELICAGRNAGCPDLTKGSQPTDRGHLILNEDECLALLANHPEATPFGRPYRGSSDFINHHMRYCLWLVDAPPAILRHIPKITERISAVAKARAKSPAKSVQADARTPSIFTQIRQPENDYLVIPEVSSQRRHYIPIGYNDKSIIASMTIQIIPATNVYLFGLLTSAMHMAWMRQVAGRLKSDYRYTPAVSHMFVLPTESPAHREKIETNAQAVLDERAKHSAGGATLADLYDPVTMPPGLAKAHAALDRAVDRAYRSAPFTTERARIEYLFGLYQTLGVRL